MLSGSGELLTAEEASAFLKMSKGALLQLAGYIREDSVKEAWKAVGVQS